MQSYKYVRHQLGSNAKEEKGATKQVQDASYEVWCLNMCGKVTTTSSEWHLQRSRHSEWERHYKCGSMLRHGGLMALAGSLRFTEDGRVNQFTIGYVMDRYVGNTGGGGSCSLEATGVSKDTVV
eukprot:1513415-Amphidinium_carterae.2